MIKVLFMRFRYYLVLYILLLTHTQYSLYLRNTTLVIKLRCLHVLYRSYLYWGKRLFIIFALLITKYILLPLITITINIETIIQQFLRKHWLQWVPIWMGNPENLFWTLPELVYLTLQSHSLYWVSNLLNVHHTFICQWMENVTRFYCLLSTLLVSKN